MPKIITTQDIIKRFNKIHHDKYDYSEVKYKGSFTNVIIICPYHGKFEKMPCNFLKKDGCNECRLEKHRKHHKQKYLEASKKIHGDKYDYSKVNYINTKTPIEIICPIHGSFKQLPLNHKNGFACLKCGEDIKKISIKKLLQQFKEKHGDTYDYSKVKYVNSNTPIEIICPIHGSFKQIPKNHKKGVSCYKCSKEKEKFTLIQVLSKCKKTHGDKYDYSKTIYKGSDKKIEIICKKHGSFWQVALAHYEGAGCKMCATEKHPGVFNKKVINRNKNFFKKDKNNIYLVKFYNSDIKLHFIKIGISKNVVYRQNSQGLQYEILYQKKINTYDAWHLEQEIIKVFKKSKIKGTLKAGGSEECFKLEAKKHILQHLKLKWSTERTEVDDIL